MPLPYAAHLRFVAPARSRSEPWRLALGIVMVVVIYIGLLWAVQAIVMTVLSPDAYLMFRQSTARGATAGGALFILGSFACLAVAIMAVAHQLHGRGPATLVGPPRLALRQGVTVLLGLTMLFTAIWLLPPSEVGPSAEQTLPVLDWAVLLPLSIPALLIQTTAEELAFRGYIQQQLAARFRSPLIWMGLPACLFGLMHYRPEAGGNAPLLMAWAALFSLAAADLTARAGTLGPAIVLHFASNATAILFVSYDSSLSGLALHQQPLDLADTDALRPMFLADCATLLLCWLTARLILRR
ncbi:CPBP family intramembrane glutamic endopeptidase [Thalassovita taeanensis]|uniref:CAAX prenyl protease 2/Lysostaphin resistance protein A-like domain-containing protein n=1 Tax=Thalassovita taeanensis TaxID=657014 RepID=A0A1H9DQ11_9RHOB|nr:CPBP family intramembrane glutamic endopeptidase [Thalassovita taeanensis]SEQ15509.1 hypothetical protein SAMN04488092_104239 [Thalassovita taeanensis]